MKTNQIQDIIRKVISEAKEDIKKKKETGLPKSSGKLVELKKELTSLKKMKESLPQSATVNEGDETASPLTVEYAHMQKFVNEIEKIKAMTAKLSEMLTTQISEVEDRIKNETIKIKEMIGISVPAPTIDEKKKPSAGMSKKEKSSVVKKAKAGEDIGKPGKGFEKVAKAAGGGEKGQKVAAAQMWKQAAKKSIKEARYSYDNKLGDIIKQKYDYKKTSDDGIFMIASKDHSNKDIIGYVYNGDVSPVKGKMIIVPQSDELEDLLKSNNVPQV